jgi:hypothetical protein
MRSGGSIGRGAGFFPDALLVAFFVALLAADFFGRLVMANCAFRTLRYSKVPSTSY